MISDEMLVNSAAEVARLASDGHDVSLTTTLLVAAASQRDEETRHELQRQAAARVGQLTAFGTEVLLTIFHLTL